MASWRDAPEVEGAAKWQSAPAVDEAPASQPEEWERAVLLPIEKNRKTGEWRLALPGFVQAGIDAATLPGDVYTGKTDLDPRVSYRDQDPATLDRAATLAGGASAELPLAARGMVQQTARNLVDETGKRMPKLVADELERANIAPAAMQSQLDNLGPAGVVGDLSPRLQARVGAVATTPGPGQDIIVDQMRARQAGANARIKAGVEETFGPDPVPSRVAAQIDADRQAANAAYSPVLREKALSSDFLYDAKPLADALSREIPNFVGETRTKIQAVRDLLINPETGQLTTDPQVILAIRHEIDGMMGELAAGGNKTTFEALKDMRQMIDGDLAQQVPGIKWADAGRAEVAAQSEAFELGRNVLKGGDNPVHPVDLEATMEALRGPKGTAVGPRAEPSKAPLRVSEGTLTKIYEIVGTTANDRVALKQILKGEGSWNRDKLVTIFGKEKADALVRLLDAEAKMQETEALAFGGSKTEVVRSAKDGIEPSKKDPGVLLNAGNLQFGSAAASLADKATGGLLRAAQQRRNAEIARVLMSRGGWRPGGIAAKSNPGMMPLQNIAVLEALMDRGKRGGMLTGGGF
jgi:hypothetical protein